jgi:hypothetical protein
MDCLVGPSFQEDKGSAISTAGAKEFSVGDSFLQLTKRIQIINTEMAFFISI